MNNLFQKLSPYQFLVVGFLIASIHLTTLLICNGLFSEGFWQSWYKLYIWDSQHYLALAKKGYASFPANQPYNAFFPGYPFASRVISKVLSLDITQALFVTAFIFSGFFWSVLYLLMKKLRVDGILGISVFVFIASYPGALFLCAAYSESLFLFTALVFIMFVCFGGTFSKLGIAFSSIATFIMAATRVIALPVLALPIAVLILDPKRRFQYRRYLLMTFSGSLFYVIFWSYSEVVLGQWNLYFFLSDFHWHPWPANFLILFKSSIYDLAVFNEIIVQSKNLTLTPKTINFLMIWFFSFLFLLCFLLESLRYRKFRSFDSDLVVRLVFYGFAFATYFIPLTAIEPHGDLRSFMRYALVPLVFLILPFASLISEKWTSPIVKFFCAGQLLLISFVFGFWQYLMLIGFAKGMGGA